MEPEPEVESQYLAPADDQREQTASPLLQHLKIANYHGSQNSPDIASLSKDELEEEEEGSEPSHLPPPPPPMEKKIPEEGEKLNSLQLHEQQKTPSHKMILEDIRKKGSDYMKRASDEPMSLDKIVSGSVSGSFVVNTSLFARFVDSRVVIDDYTSKNRKYRDDPPTTDVLVLSSNEDGGESEELWMQDLVSYLSGWLYHSLFNAKEEEEKGLSASDEADLSPSSPFWKEWEWILSRSEELALERAKNIAEKQSNQIRDELASLKQQANLFKQRPFFRQATTSYWVGLDPEALEWLKLGLGANMRDRIFRDTIKSLKGEWVSNFREMLMKLEGEGKGIEEQNTGEGKFEGAFESLFDEKPYEQNLEGAIVSMALFASHGSSKGDGLTPLLLSEILWNIWSALWKGIQKFVDGEELGLVLRASEAEFLAKEILRAQPIIVDLWAETAKNSRGGIEREGKVVKEWAEEERLAEEKRVEENFKADCTYTPLMEDSFSLRRSSLTPQRLGVLRSKLSVLFGPPPS